MMIAVFMIITITDDKWINAGDKIQCTYGHREDRVITSDFKSVLQSENVLRSKFLG